MSKKVKQSIKKSTVKKTKANSLMPKSIFSLLAVASIVITIAGFIFIQKTAVAKNTNNSKIANMVVYKSPTCGCCKKWVGHIQDNGFSVETHNLSNLTTIKAEAGIARNLQSCHTAKVGGYVIEGHVPADLVAKLLKEKPDIKGLTVPGMVTGSPGMEVPGRPKVNYDVLAIHKDGSTSVYASR